MTSAMYRKRSARAHALPRRSKHTRSALRKPTLLFETLPVEVNAAIVRFIHLSFRNCDSTRYETQEDLALALLEVGGILSEAAAVQFGSWCESYWIPENDKLWLSTFGKKYKTTRKLMKLMRGQLHTISLKNTSLTKMYAAMIRVHCQGLRTVEIYTYATPKYSFEGMKAVLKACGKLENLTVHGYCYSGKPMYLKYFDALLEFVGDVKTLKLQVRTFSGDFSEGKVKEYFGGIFDAALAEGSSTVLVKIKIKYGRQEIDAHLHISRRGSEQGTPHFLMNGEERNM